MSTQGRPGAEPIGPWTADARVVDLRAELRRATDELADVRVRLERDAARAELAMRVRLVGQLVPILDDLDRALGSHAVGAPLVAGVELVRVQLERLLESYGLEPIATVGTRFDPAQHEAVATLAVADPAHDGVITDVVGRGYRLDGRVVVPARVRVAKLTLPRGGRSVG